ncbi:biliverdin-producing heme oxygenase [Cellulomonas fengjieae]|uniref:Biliverdin-producing heme oxygenase n=1 Tax=Cellulomonas fengjieae TaxID=2819978 RepID=A0ABS3SK80_9CELL|nr:biliverdin-producing heme oxygenase [Cellulomonas fengjieae]MBO3086156.1 biliverdin-producing heme oxygenase [Cellulomonas fengjieae]QVI65783.1 biliverdin-producing heme oxygenase [Cellulomonas fengjieae]
MTAIAVPQVVPLSVALREGTRGEHETAESSGFVEQLMSGGLDRAAYADLAAQQLAVYTALEAAGARLEDDGGLVFAELTRVPAIEQDLAHLYGPGWRTRIRVLPATQVYVDRLVQTGDSLPRYAAHAYTRYLGDLSGGQIIKRMLQRHYGFTSDGISFYDFPQIHKLKPFKDVYRERLDAIPLDDEQRVAVVEEARYAFRLNADVFAELGAAHVR